jgi:hypothetical protein
MAKKKTKIGRIISDQMHKGKPQKQAIAIAFSMVGKGRKKGRKKKGKKKK